MPEIYVFGGCNGSGKTTLATKVLSSLNNQFMDKINFSPDNIGNLFQQAIDEALEQHRIKGESIAISENGKVKIIPPEKITPLVDKLKKRKAQEQPQHK